MALRVAISQSNYVPWKGYFDLIDSVDLFILLDNVQFTRRDWRNRNLVKGPSGPIWLTVPVLSKGKYHSTISEMEIASSDWKQNHLRTLEMNYSKAREFDAVFPWLQGVYQSCEHDFLSGLNRHFLTEVMGLLDIQTAVMADNEFEVPEEPTLRLLEMCRLVGAKTYVSGPAAKAYLDQKVFSENGIEIEWFDYGPYKPYQQPWNQFEDHVSILDTLLCTGDAAVHHVRGNQP